ncbi:MAG: hypothetical protein AAFX09_02625 [Pseudomonadota bacterium]
MISNAGPYSTVPTRRALAPVRRVERTARSGQGPRGRDGETRAVPTAAPPRDHSTSQPGDAPLPGGAARAVGRDAVRLQLVEHPRRGLRAEASELARYRRSYADAANPLATAPTRWEKVA